MSQRLQVRTGLSPEQLKEVADTATSFRRFLNYWNFIDQETGNVRVLGEVLWAAQEEFVRTASAHDWIFFLKARKLGETTIECAWDGYVQRFGPVNSRVHLWSRRDDAAQELLAAVKFGITRLPEHMQLPVSKSTTHEFELAAGQDDRRLVKAYPADEETAVEATCNHGHIDEWARMRNPKKVWQAIKPSLAGTAHIVTTGLGPTNFSSGFWRQCMAGDVTNRVGEKMIACFIGALNRPDRTPEWLANERASMGDDTAAMQEYPMTWREALSGGGEYVFKSREVDRAAVDTYGLQSPREGRRYSIGADIGRHQDAAVIVVLDVTRDCHDVVHYRRMREATYPEIQLAIEEVYRDYAERGRGVLGVEKNSAGEAVIENLKLPEQVVTDAKFTTSPSSKARIISQFKLALQNELIKWDSDEVSQLDAEVRGYQLPDDNVVQDSVMALAIALEYAPKAHAVGRVRGVRTW